MVTLNVSSSRSSEVVCSTTTHLRHQHRTGEHQGQHPDGSNDAMCLALGAHVLSLDGMQNDVVPEIKGNYYYDSESNHGIKTEKWHKNVGGATVSPIKR